MNKRPPYTLILFVLLFILSACGSSPAAGAGGDLPVQENQGERIAKSQGEADFLDGKFDFHMKAVIDDFDMSAMAGVPVDDLYPASMISTWGGEFSIAPDGKMTGSGKVITEATFYVVDEDWCGYAYTELADHTFQIGGTLKQEGDTYYLPIKIWDVTALVPEVKVGPGEAVCSDPGPERKQGLELFVEIQRNAMIQLVTQGLHTEVGDQIQMGMELELVVESKGVEYEIWVSPEAVDLVD
jgi:hypothetical protein